MTVSVAVIILTLNEAEHVARAIQSIIPFASSIYVVDSGSTDGTVELARESGAQVVDHPFVNQAKQFQWALDHLYIAEDWVLRLDADEIIETDLAERIGRELPALPAEVTGVTFDRKHIFMGRWIRHGGRYPLTMLRLFRRGCGRIEQRWMDEHIVVDAGRVVHFAGGFADHNLKDLTAFTDKHNRYATREAADVLLQRFGLRPEDRAMHHGGTSRQAQLTRWIKERFYNRLPFAVSATGYFLLRYVGQGGFLDGREGLIYHFLQGYWYRFLVGAKVLEFDRALQNCTDAPSLLARLREVTGLDL
ncbi:glycosyltransferase family 2 protein [Devosia aurantiaca]|uniref:Glycosyltransferase family 2 protein n=1 Tax=Devosia aurantiaca TaxID=2714858 RepID=A0A6M1STZ5_9HYPH|nr:glycosyltransferase family 2 protein [Devosia aurantiaca]NGP17863.1 glycosyltransferase family 2 protein [Devosia aurantiaca]